MTTRLVSLERMLAIAATSMVSGLAEHIGGSVEDRAQLEVDLHILLAEEHTTQAQETRAAMREIERELNAGAWNNFPPAA